jgi:hypothetical protein
MDALKSKPKCLKATAEALRGGRSVVVDNTNPSTKVKTYMIDVNTYTIYVNTSRTLKEGTHGSSLITQTGVLSSSSIAKISIVQSLENPKKA